LSNFSKPRPKCHINKEHFFAALSKRDSTNGESKLCNWSAVAVNQWISGSLVTFPMSKARLKLAMAAIRMSLAARSVPRGVAPFCGSWPSLGFCGLSRARHVVAPSWFFA
jgi:hypothetical protein